MLEKDNRLSEEAINTNHEEVGTVAPTTSPAAFPGLSLLANVIFPNGNERRIASLGRRAGCISTLACLIAGGAVTSAANADPLDRCKTEGHAYYIELPSGFNYMSGFEGDGRYGVTTIKVRRGASFELGGNGIAPNSGITFSTSAVKGQQLFGLKTSPAASNCVVDQTKNRHTIPTTAPKGFYTVFANYIAPDPVTGPNPVREAVVILKITE